MSTNLKLSKAQISKIIESGGFLWSLMKVEIPLAKNVLASLGITAAGSAIDERIKKNKTKQKTKKKQKKNMVLEEQLQTNFSTISNEKMNGIIKILQALEDSNILLKGITKTIKNETKKQKGRFLSMLLGTLGASLLGNLLAGKGIVRAGSGKQWDF